MFSRRMAMWSSPRPETLKLSGRDEVHLEADVHFELALEVFAQLAARDVLPFASANGELFTRKLTVMVGSSMR
jgi:hypothetical protein